MIFPECKMLIFFIFLAAFLYTAEMKSDPLSASYFPAKVLAFNTLQAKYRGRAALNGRGHPYNPSAPAAPGAAILVFIWFSCILQKILCKIAHFLASAPLMLFSFFPKKKHPLIMRITGQQSGYR